MKYRPPKSRMIYKWKCQQCGLIFRRVSKGEPRRCPMCGDRGCKTYYGRRMEKKTEVKHGA